MICPISSNSLTATDHGHCDEPNQCICETGYGGPLCVNDIDVCGHQSPCTTGATSCTNTGLDSYYCTCIAGYTGTNCETDINECDSNPCQNDGECFVSIIIVTNYLSVLNLIYLCVFRTN